MIGTKDAPYSLEIPLSLSQPSTPKKRSYRHQCTTMYNQVSDSTLIQPRSNNPLSSKPHPPNHPQRPQQLQSDQNTSYSRIATRTPNINNTRAAQSPIYPLALVCFFAVPMCVLCTFVANLRLVIVSWRCACNGDTMTNMSVFELPPREYCNRYVS